MTNLIESTLLINVLKSISLLANIDNKNKPFELIEGICWVPSWSSYNLYFALSYQVRSNDLLSLPIQEVERLGCKT